MKSLAKDADANQNIHTTVGKQEINLFSERTDIAMSQMTFAVYLNIYRSIVKRIQSSTSNSILNVYHCYKTGSYREKQREVEQLRTCNCLHVQPVII
jgi:hypothetical protein